jgi:hypothetical protein
VLEAPPVGPQRNALAQAAALRDPLKLGMAEGDLFA